MAATRPFRAIVVGAGLVGLTAAHVFLKAGIDFVLLERHDTPLSPYGSTLALWPQTFRIFDQLGLLDAVQPILDHISQIVVLSTDDARVINTDDSPELIEKNHGYGVRITHRPDMVNFLYDSLPEADKSKILLRKRVIDIKLSEQGVTVLCDDGTSQEGSIVIGADGVRSRTRLLMQALRTGKQPDELSEADQSPYTTTYRVYFGFIPVLPGLPINARYDGAGNGVSTQIVNGTNRAWFGLYEKLSSPTSQRTRYNDEDKQALLRRWGHICMAPGWNLHDVINYQIGETTLIDLEEGLVDKWFHNRIVLVGDAVRKLEPHAGIGYNAGLTDLVVLVNSLRRLLQAKKSPSTREFDELFRTYQAARKEDTQKMSMISMRAARVLAWPSLKYKILAKYILPYLPLRRIDINKTVGPLVAATAVFEWLDERPLPTADIPWTRYPASHANQDIVKNIRFPIIQSVALLMAAPLIASILSRVGKRGEGIALDNTL
ncbi:putative monooxygenase [Xylaria palmicola]|nr:putative monooxygenase [Xylaria palmicola]